MPLKLFCSYARRDALLVNELKRHLAPLQKLELVVIIDDVEIESDGEWQQRHNKALNTADVILILLSPDFLDSDYGFSTEVEQMLERHRRKEVYVLPIILRPVYWQGTPFARLLALPTNAKPVTTWDNWDTAFNNIVQGIRKIALLKKEEMDTSIPADHDVQNQVLSQDTKNKYIEQIRGNIREWNNWRKTHPEEVIDLSFADLSFADLNFIDLSFSNLNGANLSFSNLNGANLSFSNLSGANLSFSNLISTNLEGIHSHKSNLTWATFNYACLSQSNLTETDLTGSDLSKADLTRSDLSGSDLSEVDLSEANLSEANFGSVTFASTTLARNDLRSIKGLATITHQGPSNIDLHSILLPQDGSMLHLLRGAGIPDTWVDFYRSTVMSPIQYHSCFLAYTSKDEILARRLHADLQAQGVRCWFAPEDMKIGDKILQRIDEAVHVQDKLLLLLSESALASDWIEAEVQAAFSKERREKREILFPIRVDNTIMETKQPWASTLRRTRHIGDFSQWRKAQYYEVAFERLLRDLKQS